ncbi:MAG: elongation factor 1-alpha-like protein [Homavirus sp.]|uniref:Elongation factor 1-alpha-like protein n=1 Tax=Homavirus sp. TaxID=2487769 RepID=A0A3G5AAQ5_9VIRU|nr:MAG: elongation factor 1-alpha-like protein [Homavirus sp.]
MVGQSRQHALLLNLLGMKQLIVCVNKMDEKSVEFKEERFEEVKEEVKRMLVAVGWPKLAVDNRIPIIPLSGYKGDNLIKKSDNMPWWKGIDIKIDKTETVHIDTLHDALDKFVRMPPRPVDKPFRMPVSGVFNIKGIGTVITGRIEQGIVKPGQEVKFLPTHTATNICTGKVFTIEMHHVQIDQGVPGDNIGINIKGLDKDRMPSKGDVMVFKNDNTIGITKRIIAQIQTLNIPNSIKVNYCPIGYVRTANVALKLVEITRIKSKETSNEWSTGLTEIKSNALAEVVFEPTKPFCADQFDRCEGLSRLAIMEGPGCVALGKIIGVEYQ